jgi:hypothetical protein
MYFSSHAIGIIKNVLDKVMMFAVKIGTFLSKINKYRGINFTIGESTT